MREDLILVGADIEIIELITSLELYNIVGIIDNKKMREYFDIPILGSDPDIHTIHRQYNKAKITITIDDPILRGGLYKLYKSVGFSLATLVSPDASVSSYSEIQEGVIIQKGVNIGPLVTIGVCSKVNVNANIMHDGCVGQFCSIAPNVVTLGYVKIGNNVFLGAHSTILPHIIIANNSVVGAGSVVTKNVPAHTVVKGVPAKP
jgi:sugar O-acyltransferase (sialic acid O-acetyltransferase NeuD family)